MILKQSPLEFLGWEKHLLQLKRKVAFKLRFEQIKIGSLKEG